MAKRKTYMYKVKADYAGKVKLESGQGATVLSDTTPQAVLAQFYATALGKGFIQLVATPVVAAQSQDNVTEHEKN